MHFDFSWPIWLLLIVAAICGGVQNAVAAGGSFWTFPALVYAGVPSLIANASNTVALNPALFVTAWAYRENLASLEKAINVRWMIAVSLVGGVAGAFLLIETPQRTFDTLVPWLLAASTLLFAFGKQMSDLLLRIFTVGPKTLLIVQFLIAIYGGYFGGGVGFLMLALYGLFGLRDIHAMTALKVTMAGLLNAAAVVVFVGSGHVAWGPTLMMMAAAILGGHYGAVLTKRASPRLLRGIVIAIGTIMTIAFFIKQYVV